MLKLKLTKSSFPYFYLNYTSIKDKAKKISLHTNFTIISRQNSSWNDLFFILTFYCIKNKSFNMFMNTLFQENKGVNEAQAIKEELDGGCSIVVPEFSWLANHSSICRMVELALCSAVGFECRHLTAQCFSTLLLTSHLLLNCYF